MAGADGVGGVHVAVAWQAEPGAVGAAVDHGAGAAAVVAGEDRLVGRRLRPLALLLLHLCLRCHFSILPLVLTHPIGPVRGGNKASFLGDELVWLVAGTPGTLLLTR